MNQNSTLIQNLIVDEFMNTTKMEPAETVRDIMLFLCDPLSVNAMIEATKRGKPALTGVVEALEDKLKDSVTFSLSNSPYNNFVNRQNIGRMIKFIMKRFGYVPDKTGRVGVRNKNGEITTKTAMDKGHLFASAAIYKREGDARYKVSVEFTI